jgi:coenzyme F420-dependent glucose-6-phosphate dehydrogenase
MTEIRYWTQLATEQFRPDQLIRQAVAAERAQFDALNLSDHYQPWWEPGESPHAWVVLGAIGQATEQIPIGTGVTAPVFRHNPAVVAQAFATLEAMLPGRAYLGIGSGESLNESPCGMDWPPVRDQVDRMEEALEIIGRLFDGERLSYRGRFFQTKAAYLHTRGETRPAIYVSAFGPRAARLAARLGDGLWTLADPERAPRLIEAYQAACEEAGKASGEIILQSGFSWAEDGDAALEGCRVWKGAQPLEHYVDDWHDPQAIYAHGEEQVSDQDFRDAYIISSDPNEHAERVREIERMGATIVCLQNASGAAPVTALRVYGERVLPALRAGRGLARTGAAADQFPGDGGSQ